MLAKRSLDRVDWHSALVARRTSPRRAPATLAKGHHIFRGPLRRHCCTECRLLLMGKGSLQTLSRCWPVRPCLHRPAFHKCPLPVCRHWAYRGLLSVAQKVANGLIPSHGCHAMDGVATPIKQWPNENFRMSFPLQPMTTSAAQLPRTNSLLLKTH